MSDGSIPRKVMAGVLVCFFLSGAAGLIYQVAWGKSLGLVFGHTVYAIATVLAVFMGGLAMGSAWLGRWSEKFPNPVALYGWIEILIAITGAVSLLGIAGVRQLYLAAYPAASDSPVTLLGLRFVGAALVLLVPTFLMGGTLPIMVRGITRQSADLGARLSRLYWVNTLGAVAGTLVAGFVFLPALGLKQTVAIAVGFNVLAGVIALWLARSTPPVPVLAPAERAAAPRLSFFLLASFALVGATAIAYEIAWTRLLSTIVGSSTYAFTLMLGSFLGGIVLGSAAFERWQRGRTITLGTFATTQLLIALAASATLVFFQKLPEIVPPILVWTKESFLGLVLAQFVTSVFAMLPAAFVFGFNFPVVTVLIAGPHAEHSGYGAAVGRAYAANTLGAILGATLTGFLLVPLLGAFRVVALAAAANLLLGILLELRSAARRIPVLGAQFALLILLGAVLGGGAFYNRALAHFGTVLYHDLYGSRLTMREVAETTDVLFARDGLNASIAVVRAEGYIGLRTNGKVDASNRDILTQMFSGHLAGIFHPSPKRVLVIGFGSGMTVAAAARHPEVERIDLVEIERGVIEAAQYLESLNDGVLRDPRVHVHIDDGRNFLLTTRDTYDIIISEPSNPWIAGVASLFTEEFYREARARLNPGGMLVQWIQGYALYSQDVRMVFATFVPQFPQVTLWRGESSDFLMLAQTDPQPLRLDRLRRLWELPALRDDFERLGMRQPEGVLAFYHLDAADLRTLATDSVTNTDNHTILEYRAPRGLLAKSLADTNLNMISKARTAPQPRDLVLDDLRAAWMAAGETLLNNEEYNAAAGFLEVVPKEPPSSPLALLHGKLQLYRGQLTQARPHFRQALDLDPDSIEAAHGLAEVARRLLQYETAELLLLQILNRDPSNVAAISSMARLERSRENWPQAAHWQARLLATNPQAEATDYAVLGEVLMRNAENEKAEVQFLAALERDPCHYTATRNLAEIYRTRQQFDRAIPLLEAAIRYFPDYEARLYADLASVYREAGRTREAEAVLRRGRRIFPDNAALDPSATP